MLKINKSYIPPRYISKILYLIINEPNMYLAEIPARLYIYICLEISFLPLFIYLFSSPFYGQSQSFKVN